MRKLNNIIITGGAGFIGSNLIRYLFKSSDFTGNIINVDNLTYAGNASNLDDISAQYGASKYFFEHVDICDQAKIEEIINKYEVDTIVHLAAESHVDRSIFGPSDFIKTNIFGTFSLLEAVRKLWHGRQDVLFHHVSTDEVFGSLGEEGFFKEETAYDPRSPYSASKASSDHLARAYNHTYNLPITLSNCSNNYGPYQFPEKLIPLTILNIINGKDLPVYGDGKNIRDWLYVEDHNSAVWEIMKNGCIGDSYNIGGENEWENIKLVNRICEIVAKKEGKDESSYKKLIKFVSDRPGHDRRYAIDCSKLKKELNWKQSVDFDKGLELTVDWYIENQKWVNNVISGDYRNWIENNYSKR